MHLEEFSQIYLNRTTYAIYGQPLNLQHKNNYQVHANLIAKVIFRKQKIDFDERKNYLTISRRIEEMHCSRPRLEK